MSDRFSNVAFDSVNIFNGTAMAPNLPRLIGAQCF